MNHLKPSFSLSGPLLLPRAARVPRMAVILLHGLGSNGANLMDLGHAWAPHLPEAVFLSPNAPFAYNYQSMTMDGAYQWFSFNDTGPDALKIGIRTALPLLKTYIDEVEKAYNLLPNNIYVAGFSQGAMMALALGLTARPSLGGIVAYSGALLVDSPLPECAPPPLCLVHGDQDTVVPPDELVKARHYLDTNQIPHQAHLLRGLDHGIDMRALELGKKFLTSQSLNLN
jgi:phospholipase/carboxylesterase